MAKDKAYKVLAKQENISNKKAKELIDRGLVYSGGRKLKIARGEIDTKTKFKIQNIEKIKKIYEDNNLIVVNKPSFITSEEISREFRTPLLHRLDRETSGVLLLTKSEEFAKKAIEEFKNFRVKKEYIAWCEGKIVEEVVIDKPILTIKNGNSAISKISKKGKEAKTIIEPLSILGNNSKIRVTIITGRRHQIRVHLQYINHPIIGDRKYQGREYKRVMLHSSKISFLNYSFEADEPKEFIEFEKGFN